MFQGKIIMEVTDLRRYMQVKERRGVTVIHHHNQTCGDMIESWAILYNGRPICEVFEEDEMRSIVRELGGKI
jgi:hypothetical protein